MQLGADFFKWFRFIIELVKVFGKIFGDENDQNEIKKNGF